MSVGHVADIVQRQTRAALDTVFAGVALIDEDSLQFQSLEPPPNDFAREWSRVPLKLRVPVTDVARRGTPMFQETRAELLAEYPALKEIVELVGNAAFATLPLLTAGRVIGVLAVAWPEERAITANDRDFLTSVATQCAQALERARLFDHERRVAATLQQAILPDELPAFSSLSFAGRYLPAEEGLNIGGDWYDVFPLPSGAVALVIGDVAGHGLDAAAMMAQLRNMLRAFAYSGAGPGEVLARLDEMLFSTGSDQYATCLHASFDPATRSVTWSNAGHHAPIRLDRDGRTAPIPLPHDPLLGAGGPHTETSVVLEPGTRLVLFTDGLIERRTQTIDVGIDTLVRVLHDHRTDDLDELCAYTIASTHAGEREDDLCLLVVAIDD
jgi:serine phosphatase RsbU (regulator of sigma subunit)